jgi:PAS domain S-box-containing protein
MSGEFYFKDETGKIILTNNPKLMEEKNDSRKRMNFQFNKFSIKFLTDDKDVLQTGESIINKEITAINYDGKIENYSSTKIPIKDDSGKIIGIIGLNNDLTENKRTIEELQTFLNISNGLYYAKSFYEIGKTVFDNLEKFRYTNLPGGKLSVYNSENDSFRVVYIRENAKNFAPTQSECKLQDVKYFSRIAINQKKTLLIEDTHSEYSLSIDGRQKRMPAGAMVFIPLYHMNELVGIFSFARFPRKSIDADFVRFLESIAKYISISIGELLNEEKRDLIEKKRKMIEEKLSLEHNLLWTLVNALPEDIYIKDRQFRFTLVNQTLCRTLNLKEEQILGKTDFDLMEEGYATLMNHEEKLLMETGNPILKKENVFYDSNGEMRSLLITKIPLRSANNEIIGLIGLNSETTNLKRTMEELQTLLKISQGLHLANTFEDIGLTLFEDMEHFYFIHNSGGRLSVYHEEDDIYEQVYERRITDFRISVPQKCKLSEVAYFSRRAIDSKKTLFIGNNHSEFSLNIDSRQIYAPEHSMVFIPLYYKDKFIGLFSFARISKNSIDRRLVNFLESIAKYISISVGELLIEEQRRKAEEKIRLKNEQLTEYSKLIIELQEEERQRISRELHDGINQILISAKLKVDNLRDKNNEMRTEEQIKIKSLLDKSIQEIRNISHNLHPIILDDLGLVEAINDYLEDFIDRTG